MAEGHDVLAGRALGEDGEDGDHLTPTLSMSSLSPARVEPVDTTSSTMATFLPRTRGMSAPSSTRSWGFPW